MEQELKWRYGSTLIRGTQECRAAMDNLPCYMEATIEQQKVSLWRRTLLQLPFCILN